MKNNDMAKNYSSSEVESRIYKMWEDSGKFAPDMEAARNGAKTFTIILPPPNANAALHLGHAMYSVEDVLVRWHRMQGDSTLWLPGSDHAGFETQVVYEKHLAKDGKSRFDFERNILYQDIWNFVQENKSTMENQVRRLGFSLDWSRQKFTLDPEIITTVHKTFKKMYDDGLLYRDARLVNYCTKHGTGFSDLEVQYEERNDPLYYMQYGPFVLATVRPETKFGDTAVAVNPNDERYKQYIGQEIEVQGLNGNFKLKVIADDYVDPEFGTGVVKMTPAHDFNDFEVAKRHNLEMKQVVGFDGRLTELAGPYAGLKVAAAREKIVEALKEKGLIVKVDEKYMHNVATCYKCGTVLEPLPLPQWYVSMKKLAEPAIAAVQKGQIKIVPDRFEKTYYQWLENIRDWNISRQIVWGIRIPAWECSDCMTWTVTAGETPEKCSKCESTNLIQDSDTFDTWFSSGQWPFATLGYPDSEDYKYFYPTSVMETGYDILFFWVARMVMMGLYVTGKVPFETIYLHGLVRDPKGQKMSKSKGNVVNPMTLLDKYGADAVRMSLIVGTGAGNDQNLSEPKMVGFRNFTNKIWNIARFILMRLESFDAVAEFNSDLPGLRAEDQSILESYNQTVKSVTESLEKFRLSDAGDTIYHFIWHEFADKYIESVKDRLEAKDIAAMATLLYIFKGSLKLLHPFMPFVTEEIWSKMPRSSDAKKGEMDMLMTTLWPK